jgi:hypothetical protein
MSILQRTGDRILHGWINHRYAAIGWIRVIFLLLDLLLWSLLLLASFLGLATLIYEQACWYVAETHQDVQCANEGSAD